MNGFYIFASVLLLTSICLLLCSVRWIREAPYTDDEGNILEDEQD